MAIYTYSLSVDFGNEICSRTLVEEIEAESGITTNLTHITVATTASSDNVDIVFDSALSGSEQTALDGVVAAHDGSTCPELTPQQFMPLSGNQMFTGPVSFTIEASTGNGIPAIYVKQLGQSGEMFMFENYLGNVIMELRQGTAGAAIWRFFKENGETLIFQLEDGDVSFGQTVSGATPTEDYHLATKSYVDGQAGGVFGSEYNYEASESQSSTTNTSWQNKIDFDIDVPAGTYVLHWYSEIRMSSTSYSVRARVDKDGYGTETLASVEIEPQDSDNWYPFSGMVELDLDGTHDIDLDYSRVGSGGTAYIRRARFMLWRIS